MAVRLSQMYGMDIYSEDAGYVGKVNDMILNMESGEVVRLTTMPIKSIVE
jgi:sporulation protein YlmC with PRC-barrel domain